MKIRRLRYGLPYEPYIHEPELRFFEGELMGEQEPPPAQPRLFECTEVTEQQQRLMWQATDPVMREPVTHCVTRIAG